ncbi:PilW family protein [Aquabacterium sp.]|uniref:PilW family protein n=1 Tax=Aquabacterium sp. TaxID=1872578 RepID=UPI003D6CCED5
MKQQAPARLAFRGISLIEIMVAMAIGLVVIGAVLSTYLHSRAGSRQAAALAQVTEDASLAMGILRGHVAMAGYGQPVVDAAGAFNMSRLTGEAIVGCDGGFNGGMVINPTGVICRGGTTTPDALIVRYEVDAQNGPLVSNGSTMVPSDCQGGSLAAGASPFDYFVSDSRFSIGSDAGGGTALECRGSGGIPTTDATATAATTAIFGTTTLDPAGTPTSTVNGSVSLVNNIHDMQIVYGLGNASAPVTLEDGSSSTRPGKRVETYVKAADVGAPTHGNWKRVVSVRICLEVNSEEEVLDQITAYRGCDDATANPTALKTPTDRRIYRAFTTTIVLNNRT